MKIYLAGKIGVEDWRHTIVHDLKNAITYEGDSTDYFIYPDRWPHHKGAIFLQHDYIGPFFAPTGNHNFRWSAHPSPHGAAVYDGSGNSLTGGGVTEDVYNFITHNHSCVDNEAAHARVLRLCLQAIMECDVVFVWMDSMTAYGTLVEIGYAKAHRKKIWWAEPNNRPYDNPNQDLWFARYLSDRTINAENARGALERLLEPTQQMSGYVYLLESGRHFKIGKSKNVDQRVTQISPKTPLPVKLVHAMPSDDMAWAESVLHRRYASYRTNGEWFALPDSEVSYICKTSHLFRQESAR